MRLLLDTHTILWTLFKDEKLSEKSRELIIDPQNDVFVSIISYWEIALKYGIGKLELQGVTPEEIPYHVTKMGIDTLGITEIVASTFHKLPRKSHKDPFDRMVVWQSIREDMTLVSTDAKLAETYAEYGLKLIW